MVVILFAACFYSSVHLLIPLTTFKDLMVGTRGKRFNVALTLDTKDMKKRTNGYMQCNTDHNKEK